MPHDPITTRSELVDEPGMHKFTYIQEYEAPAGPNSEVADDPFKEADEVLAKQMMTWLNSRYPGHFWGVVADLAQGIVKLNIPILMGFNNWWVINLHTTSLADGMVDGAGQILERYRLRRGRFELGSFLEAREKHSALVMPKRAVPE